MTRDKRNKFVVSKKTSYSTCVTVISNVATIFHFLKQNKNKKSHKSFYPFNTIKTSLIDISYFIDLPTDWSEEITSSAGSSARKTKQATEDRAVKTVA